MSADYDRRFNISAAGRPEGRYTLGELSEMADEMLAVASLVEGKPKTVADLDHEKIWAMWNAPKTGARS